MDKKLKLGESVSFGDYTVTASTDKNGEDVMTLQTKGQLVVRVSPSRHFAELYSAQLPNTVDAYTESGDFIKCNNCNTYMLLPHGANKCPKCKAEGCMSWVLDSQQEANYDDLIRLKQSISTQRKLSPEQYLSEESLNEISNNLK